MSKKQAVFRLKRFWDYGDGVLVDLYQTIKDGTKTIEYRDHKLSETGRFYWASILLTDSVAAFNKVAKSKPEVVDLTEFLAVDHAFFTVGFPKNNLPRLETKVPKLEFDKSSSQFFIHISSVKEVLPVYVWDIKGNYIGKGECVYTKNPKEVPDEISQSPLFDLTGHPKITLENGAVVLGCECWWRETSTCKEPVKKLDFKPLQAFVNALFSAK